MHEGLKNMKEQSSLGVDLQHFSQAKTFLVVLYPLIFYKDFANAAYLKMFLF